MTSIRNPLLRRFWIEFEPPLYLGREGYALSGWLHHACGVTAYSLDDALYLIKEQLCWGRPLPPTRKIIEDVDVSTLDSNHVRPNMGVPIWRGVWYPPIDSQGYRRVGYR